MKKKINLSNITFFIGLILVTIPLVLRGISYFNQSKVVYNYKKEISTMAPEDIADISKEADKYNESVKDTTIVSIESAETASQNVGVSEYSFLKTGKVIGNLVIDSIDVNLPIYDGITENNLQKGIVHLDGSSYPNGKESTHALLAGHTGLSSVVLLDNIDLLQLGDTFEVEYLGEKKLYEVCNIRVVTPDDVSTLGVLKGETLVTLITCTPKGINTHRLLVTGRLTTEEKEMSLKDKIMYFIKTHWLTLILIFVITEILVYQFLKIQEKINNKFHTKDDKVE